VSGTFGPGSDAGPDWMVSGMATLAPADRPPRPPAAMTTSALSGTSQAAGTDLITGLDHLPPSRPDLAEGSDEDAEQGDLSDATWVVFQELRPQFAGLLPLGVVRDCVHDAVQDLHGSISAEALPEMAIRLAAVRLDRRLRGAGQPPGEQPASDTDGHPSQSSPNQTATASFSVIRSSAPGYPPVALTVTMTGAESWSGTG